jgi:hypothetical protein
LVQILPPQPTLRTEKDIGSENLETTTVSGFFLAIFQGGIQKISFLQNDLWGGLELKLQIKRMKILQLLCGIFSFYFALYL